MSENLLTWEELLEAVPAEESPQLSALVDGSPDKNRRNSAFSVLFHLGAIRKRIAVIVKALGPLEDVAEVVPLRAKKGVFIPGELEGYFDEYLYLAAELFAQAVLSIEAELERVYAHTYQGEIKTYDEAVGTRFTRGIETIYRVRSEGSLNNLLRLPVFQEIVHSLSELVRTLFNNSTTDATSGTDLQLQENAFRSVIERIVRSAIEYLQSISSRPVGKDVSLISTLLGEVFGFEVSEDVIGKICDTLMATLARELIPIPSPTQLRNALGAAVDRNAWRGSEAQHGSLLTRISAAVELPADKIRERPPDVRFVREMNRVVASRLIAHAESAFYECFRVEEDSGFDEIKASWMCAAWTAVLQLCEPFSASSETPTEEITRADAIQALARMYVAIGGENGLRKITPFIKIDAGAPPPTNPVNYLEDFARREPSADVKIAYSTVVAILESAGMRALEEEDSSE